VAHSIWQPTLRGVFSNLTFVAKKMNIKLICMGLGAFMLPLVLVVALNWDEVRPYFVGDPDVAKGKMLYFATKG